MGKKRYDLKGITIGVLIASAASMVLLPSIQFLREPHKSTSAMLSTFDKTDGFNKQLNYLQMITAPIIQYVPPEVALQYVGEEELFVLFQAVLAPRRIGTDLSSPYTLLYAGAGETLERQAVQQNAHLLLQLSSNTGLLKKEKLP